jgi:hypothetical protein
MDRAAVDESLEVDARGRVVRLISGIVWAFVVRSPCVDTAFYQRWVFLEYVLGELAEFGGGFLLCFFEDAGQRHGRAVLAFAFVRGFHEGENLDCFLR